MDSDSSPATILDLTRRAAADAVQLEYDTILKRVRNAPILYVYETSMPTALLRIQSSGNEALDRSIHHPAETFVVIRKSRSTKVLIEVLTSRFNGMIVCDGWKP